VYINLDDWDAAIFMIQVSMQQNSFLRPAGITGD